jgi:hypothetical protein
LRNRLILVTLWLCWILVGPLLLYGQEQNAAGSTEPVITTDRPAVTDSSIVVPRSYLLFENGFTETGNQGQQNLDLPETLIRFGLTSKTELRFTVPDYFQNFNMGRGFASGWGDLSFGVKQQLMTTSTGLDASLIVMLNLPTGANAISSHGDDPQFLLPWSHPFSKNWAAAGMFALLWPTQGATRNLIGQPSFLLDRQITNRWDTFIEYAGDFPQRGRPQHLLHLGTAFKITSNQQFDFHVGFPPNCVHCLAQQLRVVFLGQLLRGLGPFLRRFRRAAHRRPMRLLPFIFSKVRTSSCSIVRTLSLWVHLAFLSIT